MQGNYGAGIAHANGGSKILCEIQYDERTKQHQHEALKVSSVPYVQLEVLKEHFKRLSLQIALVRYLTCYMIIEQFRPRF